MDRIKNETTEMKSTPRWLTWRWFGATLLVIAAVLVMARLGIWQLDRLTQRRAFNERVLAQINRPELDLNREMPVDALYEMEYRPVKVTGRFDHSQDILLRNQVWEGDSSNMPGYHILTPLIIEGSSMTVLVDRGWIPFDQAEDLTLYQDLGTVTIRGQIRRPQTSPDFGGVPDPTLAPGQARLPAINLINLEKIQAQVPQELLPVYIQQAPEDGPQSYPYKRLAELELTEGPHMGYAIQWFLFALIALVGYPFFVRRQLDRENRAR